MSEELIERQFNIQEETLDNLEYVCKVFKITKETFMRIAIYHGIRRMINGYRPKRLSETGSKRKQKITMPNEAWTALDNVLNKTGSKYPVGKLINTFINIELQQFIYYTDPEAYCNIYEIYKDKTDNMDNAETAKSKQDRTIKKDISVDIPEELFNEVCLLESFAGIRADQAWRFFLNRGLLDEHYSTQIDTIQSDEDLLEEIDILGLNRQKTFTLLSYLLKNKRITWHREI